MGFVLLREAKDRQQHKVQNKRNEILRFAQNDIRAPVFGENLCLPVRFDVISRNDTQVVPYAHMAFDGTVLTVPSNAIKIRERALKSAPTTIYDL